MGDQESGRHGSVRKWTPLATEDLSEKQGFVCGLPATDATGAARLLEGIGRGGGAGAGVGLRLNDLGVSMPAIRSEYERQVNRLVVEVAQREKMGQPAKIIAEYVVRERREIAIRMRARSGVGTRVLFEVRDWQKYGWGGRTFSNIEARYVRRGITGDAVFESMYKGATEPNIGVSDAAIRGARYLKYGGRVILVVSIAATAYRLLTAPQSELEKDIHEEVGGLFGGFAGSGAAVGACLVFGVATGGWGLLACGVIGGAAGGIGGSWVGDRIYYARHPNIETRIQETAVVWPEDLTDAPSDRMCEAPLSLPSAALALPSSYFDAIGTDRSSGKPR
jgi:hypothetical protein